MFGLKIFVRVQTFRRVPPVLPRNFCHPVISTLPDEKRWFIMMYIIIIINVIMIMMMFIMVMISIILPKVR